MTNRRPALRTWVRVGVGVILLQLVLPGVGLRPASAESGTCYLIADSGIDMLRTVDPGDSDPGTNLTDIGGTGTSGMGAIAMNGAAGILYGAVGGQLGTIDAATGAFTPTSQPFGTAGAILLDNVEGLTYDSFHGVLYGSHQRAGDLDVLFQVDPVTGAHVPEAFGPGLDFVLIGPAPASIEDIAADPSDGRLYGVSNDGQELIAIASDGTATLVGSVAVSDLWGLAFDSTGQLWGTGRQGTQEVIGRIDPDNASLSGPVNINTGEHRSVECLDVAPTSRVVINEVLFNQTPGFAGEEEFVELYNATTATVSLEDWKLSNGDPTIFYTFPVGASLDPGEHAVIWTADNSSSLRDAPSAAFQDWANQGSNFLNEGGDAIWLHDGSAQLVDYVAWGSGGLAPAPPEWDATHQGVLTTAARGQSISLTPNGADGDDSACWEPTTSGDASGRCPGALPTVDIDPVEQLWSPGVSNDGTVPNAAPVLDPVGDRSVDELALLSFTATASDPDVPANTLVFSLSGAPAGASITPGGAFTWTPTEAQGPGAYSFTVVVTETDGAPTNLSDSETITVTVAEVNVAPVLDPVGNQLIEEGSPLSFSATAADADDPPNTLVFSLSGAPAGASITPGGVFSWTPAEAQGPGSYTFDVIVADDGTPELNDSESITVTVTEENLPPVLDPVADYVTNELVNLSFTATASDPNTPANSLVFSLSGAPAGASITPGGVFSWTPSEAQGPGSYTFDVMVTETDGSPSNLSDSETITVTVGEDNIAPSLDPLGDQITDELSLISFTATASDPDLPADTVLFSLVGAPVGAVIDPNLGEFTWTPTEAQGPGAYTFVVVVTDNGTPNLNDSETITVTVAEVNTAPVADPVPDQTADELIAFSLTATATDADEPANALSWSVESGPGAVTAAGNYTWTPSEDDGPGTFAVVLRVTDDGAPALSDTVSFDVTVDEVNASPILDPIGNRVVDEGALLGFTATATDPDVPANMLTYALSGAVPAGASITPGGVFSWSPTEAHGPGSFTFDVVVTEADGSPTNLSDSETITVTVNEANIPPVTDAISDQFPAEGDTVTLTATATDADLPADSLVWSLDSGPGAVDVAGNYTWVTTETDGPGTYPVVLRVTDNGSPPRSETVSFDITVGEVNGPPALDPVGDKIVDELAMLTFTATASDGDLPGNGLTFSLAGAPAGASITPGGVFTWTPTEAQGPGSHTFDVVVADSGSPNLSDAETITVTVTEVNTAPVADPIPDQTVAELAVLSLTARASDSDEPANSLVWVVDSGPGFVLPTGEFFWTPTEADGPGTYTVTFRVVDDGAPAAADAVSFDITVFDVNTAPVLDPVGDHSVDEGSVLIFTATASDADVPVDSLAFSLSGAPVGAAIDPGTGEFAWIPSESQGPGVYGFDVVVTDTGIPNMSDSEAIVVTVNELASAPVLDPVPDWASAEGERVEFTVTASDIDLPAEALTYSATGLPPGLAIDPATGLVSGTVSYAAAASSPYTVEITVIDGLRSATRSFEWTVADINRPPVPRDDFVSGVSDVLILIDVLANDTDPDGDWMTVVSFTQPDAGFVTADGDALLYRPAPDGSGTFTFGYTVADPAGRTADATVRVTVELDAALPDLPPVDGKPLPTGPGDGTPTTGSESSTVPELFTNKDALVLEAGSVAIVVPQEAAAARDLEPTEGLMVAFRAASETLTDQALVAAVLGMVVAWLLLMGVERRQSEESGEANPPGAGVESA